MLRRHRRTVKHDRRAHARDFSGLGGVAGKFELHAAVNHLRVGKNLFEIVDRSRRHADGFELVQKLVALDLFASARRAFRPARCGARAGLVVLVCRLFGEVRRAEHVAQLDELAVVAGRDDDVAVGDREHLVGHDVGMRIADALGDVCRRRDS